MPPTPDGGPLAALPRLAVLAAATAALALLAAVIALRAGYPFQLEWMEGGVAAHAERVLRGEPLYVEPSVAWTPFIYTPAGYWASAASMALLGVGLPAVRAVSIAATAVLLALIALFVRRETRRLDAGIVAAGLFAATWELTGAWLDLARVDALFLALLVGSVVVLRASRGVAGDVGAAAIALLAFLAKQSALPVAAALAVWCALARSGARRAAFPAAILAGLAGTTVLGDAATDGWYSYYVFALPAQHRVVWERIAAFWLVELRPLLPAIAAAAAVPLLLARRGRRADAGFFAALLAGTAATSWAGRVHVGGWLNAALPLVAAVALTLGAGLPLLARLGTRSDEGPALPLGAARGTASRSPLARPLVAAALVAQFLLLVHDPRDRLPGSEDRAAGEALVARLASVEGGAYVPFHGYLARRAGKEGAAHAMALEDVFRGADEERRTRLRRRLSEALHDGRFAVVVLDRDRWGMQAELRHRYVAAAPPFDRDDVFWTVTGLRTRPAAVYLLLDAPGRPR